MDKQFVKKHYNKTQDVLTFQRLMIQYSSLFLHYRAAFEKAKIELEEMNQMMSDYPDLVMEGDHD